MECASMRTTEDRMCPCEDRDHMKIVTIVTGEGGNQK